MTEWKCIYDKWLKEGDLRVLMYLQKIQRYLGRGRIKTKQEKINLMAQIQALLDLTYKGTYRSLVPKATDHGPAGQILLRIMRVDSQRGPQLVIPDLTDKEAIAYFLRNANGARIKPQAVDQFQTHPLWILWGALAEGALAEGTLAEGTLAEGTLDLHRTALWLYRNAFLLYMTESDYIGAATVFIHARSIKIRDEPLPLLHQHVIQQIMYANLDSL
jgi:hypothetical protein